MFRVEATGSVTEEQMERRLEYLFQEPGLKISDVILSVGSDEEMMEVVRKLSEENNSQPDIEQEGEMLPDITSLEDQIKSYEEELGEIVADMRLMREQQRVGCPEDRKEILLNLIADLEISAREDDTRLERLQSRLDLALRTERSLKEELNKQQGTEADTVTGRE